MRTARYLASFIFLAALSIQGCNIVPKSVQYQKEEEGLIGSTDIANIKVEEIQTVLTGLGYETGNTDGRIGQKTREAIKEFQESMGIKSTGYIDRLTLMQIDDMKRVDYKDVLEESYRVSVKGVASSSGEDVPKDSFKVSIKDVQTALKKAGFNPGSVDGKMGKRTRQALKEFQKTKGLKPDGVAGPKTWSVLSKYLDK